MWGISFWKISEYPPTHSDVIHRNSLSWIASAVADCDWLTVRCKTLQAFEENECTVQKSFIIMHHTHCTQISVWLLVIKGAGSSYQPQLSTLYCDYKIDQAIYKQKTYMTQIYSTSDNSSRIWDELHKVKLNSIRHNVPADSVDQMKPSL